MSESILLRGIPELPKDSFLSKIFEYVRKKSHAPDEIIFWTIFSFCGASLQDKIYFDFAGKLMFPNFPLLIIAGSGVGKTSSINIIGRIFEGNLPYWIPEDCTSEALFKNIAKKGTKTPLTTCSMWVVPEMADTFGKKDYQSGLVPKITRLLDNPYNKTVSRAGADEDITIPNVCVFNWICASTFKWLIDYCEDGMSAGGFLPRLHVIKCEDDPRFTPAPSSDKDYEAQLRSEIKTIIESMPQGKQTLTEEIEAVRYEFHQELIATHDEDKRNYLARQHESFLRVYMILLVFMRKFHTTSEIISLAKKCSKWLINNNLSLYRHIKMRNILPNSNRSLKGIDNKLRKSIAKPLKYIDIMKGARVKTTQLEPLLLFYKEHGVIQWDGKKGENGTLIPLIDPADFWKSFYVEDAYEAQEA